MGASRIALTSPLQTFRAQKACGFDPGFQASTALISHYQRRQRIESCAHGRSAQLSTFHPPLSRAARPNPQRRQRIKSWSGFLNLLVRSSQRRKNRPPPIARIIADGQVHPVLGSSASISVIRGPEISSAWYPGFSAVLPKASKKYVVRTRLLKLRTKPERLVRSCIRTSALCTPYCPLSTRYFPGLPRHPAPVARGHFGTIFSRRAPLEISREFARGARPAPVMRAVRART